MQLKRTTSNDPSYLSLVVLLDAELKVLDGDEHDFYAQYNKSDSIDHVIVACRDDDPVGIGALKKFSPGVAEIKRMYIPPDSRGRGIASEILRELENWAAELGFSKCILETGLKQPEAISLYRKHGYKEIPNYGQYAGVENSKCFEKSLK